MTDLELASVALRTLVYAGSIAVAGGALFALSLPRAASSVPAALQRQMRAGLVLLLVAEPLRYVVFQLSIADGDAPLAFSSDMRALWLQTPIGHAALLRLVAAAVLVAIGLRVRIVGAVAAAIMIGSFLLEGHTAASDYRAWVAPFLAFHLAGVHWWLGALLPLIAVTYLAETDKIAEVIEDFGRQALWVVAVLVAAGVVLVALLTGGVVNLENPYQQRLLIKLALVAGLLAIAAVNKLRLTPMLRDEPSRAVQSLRASIRIEAVIAFAVLAATAWLTATSPED